MYGGVCAHMNVYASLGQILVYSMCSIIVN